MFLNTIFSNDSNKATGPDKISNKMIISIKKEIAKPLCLLFNIDGPRFSIENKDVQYGKYGESTKLEFYVYSFSVKEFDTLDTSADLNVSPVNSCDIHLIQVLT
jgi:hypothetical protein